LYDFLHRNLEKPENYLGFGVKGCVGVVDLSFSTGLFAGTMIKSIIEASILISVRSKIPRFKIATQSDYKFNTVSVSGQ